MADYCPAEIHIGGPTPQSTRRRSWRRGALAKTTLSPQGVRRIGPTWRGRRRRLPLHRPVTSKGHSSRCSAEASDSPRGSVDADGFLQGFVGLWALFACPGSAGCPGLRLARRPCPEQQDEFRSQHAVPDSSRRWQEKACARRHRCASMSSVYPRDMVEDRRQGHHRGRGRSDHCGIRPLP